MKYLRTYKKAGCKWIVHIVEQAPPTYTTRELMVVAESPLGKIFGVYEGYPFSTPFADFNKPPSLCFCPGALDAPAYIKKLARQALNDLALIQALTRAEP